MLIIFSQTILFDIPSFPMLQFILNTFCKMCLKTIYVSTDFCSHAENRPLAQTFIDKSIQRNQHFAACVTPFKSFREK